MSGSFSFSRGTTTTKKSFDPLDASQWHFIELTMELNRSKIYNRMATVVLRHTKSFSITHIALRFLHRKVIIWMVVGGVV